MEAGNYRPDYETDAPTDEALEDAEVQYNKAPDAVSDGGKTITSLATASRSSHLDEPLMASSTAEQSGAPTDLARLEELFTRGVAEILKAFQDKLAFDQFKEVQITRLHDELQGYKADLLARACRPLVSGIIRLHDDIGKISDALRKRDPSELSPEKFFRVIDGFQQDIELILDQNGIEVYRVAGEQFDPRRQKALVTTPTTEAGAIGLIAERLRPGFEQGSFIFQKERVAVYATAALINAPAGNEKNAPVAAAPAPTKEGEAQ